MIKVFKVLQYYPCLKARRANFGAHSNHEILFYQLSMKFRGSFMTLYRKSHVSFKTKLETAAPLQCVSKKVKLFFSYELIGEGVFNRMALNILTIFYV